MAGSGTYYDLDFLASTVGFCRKALTTVFGGGSKGLTALGTRADGYLDGSIHPPLGILGGRFQPAPHFLNPPNNNFEDGLTAWAASATGTGLAAVMDATAANKRTGVNSAKMVTAAAADTSVLTGPMIPAGYGIPLFVFAMAKSSGSKGRLTVAVNFFANDQKTANGSAVAAQVTGLPTVYAEYGGLVSPPAGSSYAQTVITLDTAADTVWVDELRMQRDRIYYGQTGLPRAGSGRDAETMWATDFGVVGDGITDDTVAMQAAINAAVAASKRLRLPPVTIRTTAPLVAAGRLVMEGQGFDMFNGGTNYPSNRKGLGTLFLFDHLGVGLNLQQASGQQDACDNHISRFGTSRRQTAAVSGTAFVPVAADYDILLQNFHGTVENIGLWGSTNGIKLVNGFATRIRDVFGQVFQNCIKVQNSYDTLHISDVHIWPYWSLAPEVILYQGNNLNVISLLRCDNPMIDNIFALYSYAVLRLGAYTTDASSGNNGVTYKAQVGKMDGDSCEYGVLIDSGADNTFVMIESLIAAGNGPTVASDVNHLINVLSNNCRIDVGVAHLNNARGSLACLGGSAGGNRLVIRDLAEGVYNGYTPSGQAQGAAQIPGLQAPGTNLIEVGSWLAGSTNERAYYDYPKNCAGAPRASGNVKGTLSRSIQSGTTDANGTVTFNHGAGQAPTVVSVPSVTGAGNSPWGICVGKTATQIGIKCFDASTGGVLANANVTVYFECLSTSGLI